MENATVTNAIRIGSYTATSGRPPRRAPGPEDAIPMTASRAIGNASPQNRANGSRISSLASVSVSLASAGLG